MTWGSGTWALGHDFKKGSVGGILSTNKATWVHAGDGGGLGLSEVVLFCFDLLNFNQKGAMEREKRELRAFSVTHNGM